VFVTFTGTVIEPPDIVYVVVETVVGPETAVSLLDHGTYSIVALTLLPKKEGIPLITTFTVPVLFPPKQILANFACESTQAKPSIPSLESFGGVTLTMFPVISPYHL
jgi:hypothetical protein